MKKCEKVIRFKTDTVERYEIIPYDNGGYRIELYMKSTFDSIITFDVANYTECYNFMSYIANYSFFYVIIGLDGMSKLFTSYSGLGEFMQ